MTIEIRPAVPSDAAQILTFITELAEYEKARHEVIASVVDIERSLFSEGATAHGLICEHQGRPIGYAVYFFNYSTWQGRHGLYLEDLYVLPALRGRGIGRRLMVHLARLALERGYGRFEWSVLDWNTPAIDFYRSLGARPMEGWTVQRVSGDALRTLAANGDAGSAHAPATPPG